MMNRIEEIISNFLWDGKTCVAKLFLEKVIKEGGLKLTNVLLFNHALKLTWVKRIIENIPSHEAKWCQVLQDHADLFPWPKYYSLNFQCTIGSKMRAFQYKILLRVIPTNKYLKLCNIAEDNTCYCCQTDIETIEHLFYFCPIIKDL